MNPYLAAKAHIEKFGWHQGAYAPGAAEDTLFEDLPTTKCPLCLEGVIRATASPGQCSIMLGEIEERIGGLLFVWNDTPGRTKQEVLDLLTRMAEETTL